MEKIVSEQHFFQVPPQQINGESFELTEAESHHLAHVLRLHVGATIWLLDGVGTAYQATVMDVAGKCVRGLIIRRYPGYGETAIPLHLGLGLLKRERMELAVEKATEAGVVSITLLLLDRCVKRAVRQERLEKVVLSAAKQCTRSWVPKIHEPSPLDQWLSSAPQGQHLVCTRTAKLTLSDWYRSVEPLTTPVYVTIGPEGDFSPREGDLLSRFQVTTVNLGPRRLRSETAVITALAIINELIQNQGDHHG